MKIITTTTTTTTYAHLIITKFTRYWNTRIVYFRTNTFVLCSGKFKLGDKYCKFGPYQTEVSRTELNWFCWTEHKLDCEFSYRHPHNTKRVYKTLIKHNEKHTLLLSTLIYMMWSFSPTSKRLTAKCLMVEACMGFFPTTLSDDSFIFEFNIDWYLHNHESVLTE